MTSNKRTVQLKPTIFAVEDFEKAETEPGCSELRFPDHLTFACPGCGRIGSISVGEDKPDPSPSWRVVCGELPRMTLTPSINCVGCCGWHGYLTDGVYRSC